MANRRTKNGATIAGRNSGYMLNRALYLVLLAALALSGCQPPSKPIYSNTTPIPVSSPSQTPKPRPEPSSTPHEPILIEPTSPELSEKGLALIYEFETGGQRQYERNPHPELPDLRYSGITAGMGYDMHQYSVAVIMHDWSVLNAPSPKRLADTHPFYGKTAMEPLKKVRDILITWPQATLVFGINDVPREYGAAKRAFPQFEDLSKNCQSALIANGFARGYALNGPARLELRNIRDLVPRKDYHGIADQLRRQERVWRGTTIYNGLRNRVYAEATLAETPDE